MDLFTLRLTHLKKVSQAEQMVQIVTDMSCADTAKTRYLARAVDKYQNVYYVTLIQLSNGHACFSIVDPQLRRSRLQMLPDVSRFLDAGMLLVVHPPLCQKCWKTEKRVGDVINHFRLQLKDIPEFKKPPEWQEASRSLVELFEQTNPEDLLRGLTDQKNEIDGMLNRGRSHN